MRGRGKSLISYPFTCMELRTVHVSALGIPNSSPVPLRSSSHCPCLGTSKSGHYVTSASLLNRKGENAAQRFGFVLAGGPWSYALSRLAGSGHMLYHGWQALVICLSRMAGPGHMLVTRLAGSGHMLVTAGRPWSYACHGW
jgi:hypothetical protein